MNPYAMLLVTFSDQEKQTSFISVTYIFLAHKQILCTKVFCLEKMRIGKKQILNLFKSLTYQFTARRNKLS